MKLIRIILILWLLLSADHVSAQISNGVRATGKHARYLKYLRQGKKALSKKDRKALRDSVKIWRKLDKLANQKLDSLSKTTKLSNKYQQQLDKKIAKGLPKEEVARIKARAKEKGIDLDNYYYQKLRGQLREVQGDSAALQAKIKEWQLDSMEIQSVLEGMGSDRKIPESEETFFQENGALTKEYGNKISPNGDSLTVTERLVGMVEAEIQQQVEGIEGFEQLGTYQQEAEKFKMKNIGTPVNPEEQTASLQQKADKEALVVRAKQLLSNNEALQGIQNKMTALKKKYSSVPNAGDLSTAVKRNSLENEPFRKRLVIGGNFQVISTDPFSIDASPTLAYEIRRNWQAGLGINYRQTFGNDSLSNNTDDLWAVRSFTRYTLWKGFFGYGEYERSFTTRSSPSDQGDQGQQLNGFNAVNIGVGRQFHLFNKVAGLVILTYDILHDPSKSVNNRPLNIRVGFQIEK